MPKPKHGGKPDERSYCGGIEEGRRSRADYHRKGLEGAKKAGVALPEEVKERVETVEGVVFKIGFKFRFNVIYNFN